MKPVLLLLCLLLTILSPAFAAPVRDSHEGPYVGAYYGLNYLDEAKGKDATGSFNLDFDWGQQAVFTLGYDLVPGTWLGEGRLELEFAQRTNSLDRVEFQDGPVGGDGEMRAESLLLNSYGVIRGYPHWTPYLGVGVGAARITADGLRVTGGPLADDDDLVFAFQLGAGVEIPLWQTLNLDLGYRFFGTTRPEFAAADGTQFKSQYYSHSLLLGLRLGF